MRKIVRIGKMPVDGRKGDIFCKISVEGGKLSISGVIAPLLSGNARGGCGQIDMEFEHRNARHDDHRYGDLVKPSDIDFAPGWDRDKWWDFLEIWKQWHLNDMRATCEHQRALGWEEKATERVTIYKWKLTPEASSAQRKIEEGAMDALKRGEVVQLSQDDTKMLALEYWTKTYTETLPESIAEFYKPDGTEEKTLGWLYPTDHPEGILTRPCPECGYEYGSAWKREELPADVVAFLEALPDTDKTPAWV